MTKVEVSLLVTLVAVLGTPARTKPAATVQEDQHVGSSFVVPSCTMPHSDLEKLLTRDSRGGIGPVPGYIANYIYPDIAVTVDGVAIGQTFESVTAEHPDAIVERNCSYPRCRMGGGKAHLLAGRLRVYSADGLSVSFVAGTSLDGPEGQLLRPGMESEATIAALGYPHGEQQVSLGPDERWSQGRAWRYLYPDKVIWVLFRDLKISGVNIRLIESDDRYFSDLRFR